MHHVAIMKKSMGFLPKIASGEKTIESRWSMNRVRPWKQIAQGDMIFFKNSGEAITLSSRVFKVLYFENLTPDKIKGLLIIYGKEIGIPAKDVRSFYELVKHKKYAALVFLETPKKVRPFSVSKQGFGAMAAWITVKNIGKIKRLS